MRLGFYALTTSGKVELKMCACVCLWELKFCAPVLVPLFVYIRFATNFAQLRNVGQHGVYVTWPTTIAKYLLN